MNDLTDATFDQEVRGSPVPVIVDFWAPWCKPCRAIEPILRAIAEERGDAVRLVRVNVDENVGVPSRYDVLTLPTVVLFAGGEPVVSVLGARPRRAFDEAFAPYLP